MAEKSDGTPVVVGIDIGTSSSKGVLVTADGRLVATANRAHTVDRPAPGSVEMDAAVWWTEAVWLVRELLGGDGPRRAPPVVAVGVSGMGPCTLLTDAGGDPLRPAILYGVDTRARAEIADLAARYPRSELIERCRSVLTSQAVGPKLEWIRRHEPAVFAAARRLLMPSSRLVEQLTGEYVLDHHSASQAVPLYDAPSQRWHEPSWDDLAGAIVPPRLAWSDEIAGAVHGAAADQTGLPAGTPVIAGTIDAWSEAVSVHAHGVGDLMLMYGTTMFLVATVDHSLAAPPLWGTTGAFAGTHNLAAGMATSGAVTDWLTGVAGGDRARLLAGAAAVPPGADGLVLLPYFAGERTPFEDPDARGVIAGLTLEHTAGHLYRAALEGTAMGVRHNVAALRAAGAPIERVVAVGGGTTGGLWTQIVADVTGLTQELHEHSIGASYGSALLAARAVGIDTAAWNPVSGTVTPCGERTAVYDELYHLYLELHPATTNVTHTLARIQRGEPVEDHR